MPAAGETDWRARPGCGSVSERRPCSVPALSPLTGQDELTSPAAVQRVRCAVLSCLRAMAVDAGSGPSVAGSSGGGAEVVAPLAGAALAAAGEWLGERQAAVVREQATQVRGPCPLPLGCLWEEGMQQAALAAPGMHVCVAEAAPPCSGMLRQDLCSGAYSSSCLLAGPPAPCRPSWPWPGWTATLPGRSWPPPCARTRGRRRPGRPRAAPTPPSSHPCPSSSRRRHPAQCWQGCASAVPAGWPLCWRKWKSSACAGSRRRRARAAGLAARVALLKTDFALHLVHLK